MSDCRHDDRFSGVFWLPPSCGGCLACFAEQQAARATELEARLEQVKHTPYEQLAEKLLSYDRQFSTLSQWCKSITGIDTNAVIGQPDWPNNLVDCVIQALEQTGWVPDDKMKS